MSEKQKNYKTEWSFSFDRLGESIRNIVGEVRDGVDGEPEEIQFASFSEAIKDRDRASVFIHFGTGVSTVSPLIASDNLIEADVNYVGEVEFNVSDDPSEPSAVLRQVEGSFKQSIRTARSMGKKDDDQLRWDIRLTPNIPLQLNAHGGVGKLDLNLAGLNLSQFDYDSGVGAADITLPACDARYDADIEAGIGSTTLTLLENTDVELDITGGVGRTRVVVPPDAAVRVEAAVGMGSIDLPDHFAKQEGSRHFVGERGTWQTANYETAERRIDISFEGGIGKFEIIAGSNVV